MTDTKAPATLDPEWKALDFPGDVRPAQLNKLDTQHSVIAQMGKQMQKNNDTNLKNIDISYKETTKLEEQFIGKKMENMKLINDSEMEGIKFLHKFGETTRENESLNQQINQIKHIMALLSNELSIAECDATLMSEVHEQEQELLIKRDKMTKENDTTVLKDIKSQQKYTETELQEIEAAQTKQNYLYEGLVSKKNLVEEELNK